MEFWDNQITQRNNPCFTSLELFAGAGGIALGVHNAGFRHLGLIEMNPFAVTTLQANSKNLQIEADLILGQDAHSIDYSYFAGKVDLLSGGPPCQPFSNAGINKGAEDERNTFPIFLDVMATIMPKAVLIENVKGILRKTFKDYFDYILRRLRFPLVPLKSGEDWNEHYQRLLQVTEADFNDDEQFRVSYQLVDTADFGIPQRRERVIITAFRRDLDIEPFQLAPTHSKEALLVDQWITAEYWDRHNVEPINYLGKHDLLLLGNLRKQRTLLESYLQPWKTVRDAICDLPTPVSRGEVETFSNHVQHPGARIYKGHIGSFLDYPAKALKAGTHGTPGGENVLRLDESGNQVRYFTTREAARLHTFPDNWRFHGTWGGCIKQLGNAVPVDLATLFAHEIRLRLTENIEHARFEETK